MRARPPRRFAALILLALPFIRFSIPTAPAALTNVVWYRLGENDAGAAPGLAAAGTADLVGTKTLAQAGGPLYTNAVSTDASVALGSSLAVHFNGTSQYFSSSTPGGATNNFAIEAWVKPDNVSGGTRVIAYNGDTTNDGWGIYQSGTAYYGLLGNVAVVGGTAGTASAGRWTHVALVRAGVRSTLYVNGIATGPTNLTAPNGLVKGSPFAIATAPQAPPGEAFSGSIDEVRVFTFGTGQFNTNELLLNVQRVATLPASGLAPGTATLNGTAGLAALASSLWFEWGPTTNYGSLTTLQPLDDGGNSTNFTEILTSLPYGATYQYHAVVSNALGIAYGDNASFQVPVPPPVSNTNDNGAGSLRQVLSDAAPGDTVTFASGLTGLLSLTSGPIVIDKPLTIAGPGARILTVGSAGQDTLLQVTSGPVIVSGLSFAAGGSAGGIPAISNSASLTLSNCAFNGNSGPAVTHTSNNLVVFNCSFYGNKYGGLVVGPGATASVTNCTFVENTGAPNGGAIMNQGVLNVLSCTFAYNYANFAGGAIYSTGTTYVGNTVVALDDVFIPTFQIQDVAGAFISLGYNFIGAKDGSTGFTNGSNHDQVGSVSIPLDPMLELPPQYNGGPTMSLLPGITSFLIDRGNSFGLTTDQRGYARPLDYAQINNVTGGDGSDIGAVEIGSTYACASNCNQVTVDVSQTLRPAGVLSFGANTAIWQTNFDSPDTISLMTEMGCRTLRFPGVSDGYHWASNYWIGQSHQDWPTTVTNFMHIATNLGANVFMTANYGSGTTNEAADWVRCVNITNHCGFKYWEIGNECYYGSAVDNNTNPPYQPHDPWTYAMRFRDYYNAMKAADPTIKVGAVAIPGEDLYNGDQAYPAYNPNTGLTHYGWTPVMLVTLKNLGITPDFIVHHFYPEGGLESDPILLQQASNWANDAADLRQEITDYFGSAGTNIELFCTENNSDASYNQGKQSTSLVNGLYLADSLAQLEKTEFDSYLWWTFTSGAGTRGNFTSTFYGWRTYGDFGLALNINTKYPTFYAMKLMQYFAQPGDTILNVVSGNTFLPVYAAHRTNGTLTVLVLNKDRNNTYTRQMTLAGFWSTPFATVRSYGMPQDNATRFNQAASLQDLATNQVATAGGNFSYDFAPYSMTLFTFAPAGPPLAVARTAGNTLQISWPWPSTGWNLQQNTNLGTTNWSVPTETIQNDGTNNFITIAPPTGNRFFRLKQP